MISNKIVKVIENSGFNICDIVTYLLSLHFKLKPEYIPELVKKRTNTLGIINRDFNKGTVIWIVPLFDSTPQQITLIQENTTWIWVNTEYRQMFIDINRYKGGDKASCIIKMKQFFSENPEIRKEDVLKATKLYLEGFQNGTENPKFLQQANYFIFKGKKGGENYQSRLSQFLEAIKTEKIENTDKYMRGLR